MSALGGKLTFVCHGGSGGKRTFSYPWAPTGTMTTTIANNVTYQAPAPAIPPAKVLASIPR